MSRAVLCALALFGAAPAHAQLRALQNPSFEANDPAGPGAPNFEILPIASVPGWSSTTGEIELWDTDFNGVPAFAGNVFAEMNANTNGTLFQNICLINGEPFGWTFAHRARVGGPATQTARFQVANSSGTVIQTLATQASTTANQVWNVNTGTATYSGASGMQRVQFTTNDAGSFGNFLDAIQLTLRPFVQISAASSTGAESVPNANMATLLVTGATTSAINVIVNITGGTATLGTDYTTPGNASTFTVTIPAGTYYNSPVALGINVVDDTAVESAETIAFSISAGTGYTIANTTTCGAAVQTTGTYTITDNDGRVTLRKQWADATVGDKADVTLSRGTTAIGTLSATATTAGALVTSPTPTPVVLGETVMLAETLGSANVSRYFGTVACTGAADTNLSDGLTIGAAETAIVCTYTNTRVPALVVTKTSAVLSDPINASNPKAIPGAALRYCILVTNPGTLAGTYVAATDLLPAGITYTPGSARSGNTCATATTVEDDDATGADETDPYGVSFLAGTLTATATTLTAGASFAITFDAMLK
ncbi:hypothetical protein AQZ52_06420 [Novosphingobium fuchskuhlense]|uniref:DUF11 domain-containing protein n=1 Tax=Novosphingobium fuchskuhlense TaxID=1117702 RepID=A0A124JW12_9SPHN|nr:hypothetical protein AQZ52_06420 [Novosphingobium fuchskuhlense]